MNCFPPICRKPSSSVIHPGDSSTFPECPMCLEGVSIQDLMKCGHPTHSHLHHASCVNDYSLQIPEGDPVPCSLKCGYLFKNILGKKVSDTFSDQGTRGAIRLGIITK